MAGGFDAEFTDSPSMKGLWWLETDNTETPQIPPIKEGSYVKAYVITTHLLEVINTSLQAEALSKDTEVQIKKSNPGANLANSMSMLNENTTDNGQQQRLTDVRRRRPKTRKLVTNLLHTGLN